MAKTKTQALLDELLSTREAAAELGVSMTRIMVLINEGRLPARHIGKVWIMHRDDLKSIEIRPVGRPRKNPEDKKEKKKRA